MTEEQEELPGQKTLQAPAGCGFMDMPVLPVQVHLMCTDCKQPMPCVAQVPPLLVAATPGAPAMPDYLHQCVQCEKKVRMKQPFPTIRYAPHPNYTIDPREESANTPPPTADGNAIPTETTSRHTEVLTAASSEEE